MDNKIIQVALDGLENILRVGEADRGEPPQPGSINKYALFIEEANGMEKIHECQQNANQEIYKKAYHIIDKYGLIVRADISYFGDDDEDGVDTTLAPGQQAGQFAFGTGVEPAAQQFHFGDDINMS
jgi:importin subunit alpha-1